MSNWPRAMREARLFHGKRKRKSKGKQPKRAQPVPQITEPPSPKTRQVWDEMAEMRRAMERDGA